MKGYVANIEQITLENSTFRTVLYTGEHSQLVVMSLSPGENIGRETHADHDQFFRIESGEGLVVIDKVEHAVRAEFAVIVPAGAEHDVINTGATELKLYTLYSPPEHRDSVVHQTKDEALADDEHFDGQTTE